MNHKRFKRSLGWVLAASGLFALSGVHAQSNAVTITQSGNRVFLEVNAQQLKSELDMLFNATTSASNTDWNTVLGNGANPGMDVDFSGYDAKGIEDLIATGTLNADSLTLNKDASITGRLTVSGVTTVNDSLKATGYVTFSDSLEVVRAVSIGQTLFVTGVTSLGDSLHVVGNVDLDAMLNVDGAATFGSTLAVTGQTTLYDSLHAMEAAEFALNVEVGQHLYVDSVRSLNTDGVSISADSKVALAADSVEASFEELAFVGRYDNDTQGRIALEMSSAGDSPFNEYDGAFYAEHGEARSHLEFDIDDDEDDADIEMMAEATNNDIEYGKARVYAESEGDHADVGMEIIAEDMSNGRWSEGEIEVDIDSDDGAADLHIRLLDNNIQAELTFDRMAWDSPTDVALKSSEGKVGVYAGDDVVIRAGGTAKIEMAADEDSIAIHANAVRFEQGNVTIAENASISGSLSTTGLSVVNVIDGQVNSLGNFTSDALLEGDSNLYFSTAERTLLASMASTLDSLIAVIDALGSGSSPSEGATSCGNPVTYQGYDYATVQIGNQCWFAENLRSENYSNGDPIENRSVSSFPPIATEGVQGIYANDNAMLATYGRLYNWYAVSDSRALCPSGWHVPSQTEATALFDFLGGTAIAGGKMKASASDTPAWNGSNSSGFSALPGGYIWSDGMDGYEYYEGDDGYWWTSTPDGTNGELFTITDLSDEITTYSDDPQNGKSVRCVQDASSTASVPTVVTSAASDVAEEAATLNGSIDSDGGDAVTASGFRWGQTANLSDAQDLAGSGTSGAFTGSLTGLTAGTTYYFTAFATNGEGTAYGDTLSFETTAAAAGFVSCGDNLSYQGYDYTTVQIGSQCWFAENLLTEVMNTGDSIPNVSNEVWNTTSAPAQKGYGLDPEGQIAISGRLYNGFAAESGTLCPAGWHVSTHEDWTELEDLVSNGQGFPDQLENLMSSATDSPAWTGTNTTGFSAVTSGFVSIYGTTSTIPGSVPTSAYFWTSSPRYSGLWYRVIFATDNWMLTFGDKRAGHAVRCVQD